MKIKDRIKSFKRIPASELLPNPRNWRTHGDAQKDALRGILAEVGIADAVLARETPEGLMLIDGHLRADVAPDCLWPVLILDVNQEEADKILATHDPLAAMAEADQQKLGELLHGLEIENDALQAMLNELAAENDINAGEEADPVAVEVPELYQVVAECADEKQQQVLYERLQGEGYKCRLLML